ncbi:MAG: hypothetical protein QOH79_2195 [Acidimicrobiaceae bacterium]
MSEYEGQTGVSGEPPRMRRLAVVVMVGMLGALSVTAHAESGDPPCPPGQTPDPGGLVCVYVDKTTTAVDAQTQQAQTEQAVAAQESSWLGSALELQHRLGDALPLWDAMWVGTHNSFNTAANTPLSLSNNDSNQHVSLVDQLRLGVRGIEVDVHWNPSPWANGAYAPVVCHARPTSEKNAGCTFERLLDDELAPVRTWVDQHPGDVVLLYLEDHLDDPAGFDTATQMIDDTLGDRIYKPAAGEECPLLPMSLRRADVLAAGKQVVIMSGCGSGAWNSTVFDDSVRSEEGNPEFAGYPACTSPSVKIGDYGTKLVRFYEDSTFVSAAVAGGDPGHRLTVAEIRDMVRCGVNLFGLDQVDPSDPRLEAMVWSWAPNEPSSSRAGACAFSGSDDRFHAGACDKGRLRFACVNRATGEWSVTARSGRMRDGFKTCQREHPGSVFAVPGSGNHAQRLADAKASAGATDVWLAYGVVNGAWRGVGS